MAISPLRCAIQLPGIDLHWSQSLPRHTRSPRNRISQNNHAAGNPQAATHHVHAPNGTPYWLRTDRPTIGTCISVDASHTCIPLRFSAGKKSLQGSRQAPTHQPATGQAPAMALTHSTLICACAPASAPATDTSQGRENVRAGASRMPMHTCAHQLVHKT
jgi:hypothetical protein